MLRATSRQFSLQIIPGHGARAVLVAGGQAALELGLLGWRERHIGIGQAVLQLLDQAQPLLGGEAGDFIGGQYAHPNTSPSAVKDWRCALAWGVSRLLAHYASFGSAAGG